MMLPDFNRTKSLPSELQSVIGASFKKLPRLTEERAPLEHAPIDHIAVAALNARELRRLWQIATDIGAKVVEPVHLWPDDLPGCPEIVFDADRKYMCTVDVDDFLVVLLAPHNGSDIIADFLERSGGPSVHHFALAVDNVETKLSECRSYPYVRQITPIATDEGLLTQVFLAADDDTRIIELIKRGKDFRGTFTCKNIATLTAGERAAMIGGSNDAR
ncbi:MAG: hypothetical protein WAU88_01585 [Candidatus Zixiibacteriota bacterium]